MFLTDDAFIIMCFPSSWAYLGTCTSYVPTPAYIIIMNNIMGCFICFYIVLRRDEMCTIKLGILGSSSFYKVLNLVTIYFIKHKCCSSINFAPWFTFLKMWFPSTISFTMLLLVSKNIERPMRTLLWEALELMEDGGLGLRNLTLHIESLLAK